MTSVRVLALALVAGLLLTSCSRGPECEQAERLGVDADLGNPSASPEDLDEFNDALAKCLEEQGD